MFAKRELAPMSGVYVYDHDPVMIVTATSAGDCCQLSGVRVRPGALHLHVLYVQGCCEMNQ